LRSPSARCARSLRERWPIPSRSADADFARLRLAARARFASAGRYSVAPRMPTSLAFGSLRALASRALADTQSLRGCRLRSPSARCANRPAADRLAELQHVLMNFARLRLAARGAFGAACGDDPVDPRAPERTHYS